MLSLEMIFSAMNRLCLLSDEICGFLIGAEGLPSTAGYELSRGGQADGPAPSCLQYPTTTTRGLGIHVCIYFHA
jgi:hypothetical protein